MIERNSSMPRAPASSSPTNSRNRRRLRGMLKRRHRLEKAQQLIGRFNGDPALGQLLCDAFAPDLVKLVQRDERIRLLLGSDARRFENTRERKAMVETNAEIAEPQFAESLASRRA